MHNDLSLKCNNCGSSSHTLIETAHPHDGLPWEICEQCFEDITGYERPEYSETTWVE